MGFKALKLLQNLAQKLNLLCFLYSKRNYKYEIRYMAVRHTVANGTGPKIEEVE